MFAVFRSLHMKLMLILLLLITSLMAVVGAFLTTSVSSFYIDTFYEQISAVFSDDSDGYVSTLRARAAEPDGAAGIKEMLEGRAGSLGIDYRTRNYFILDGQSGTYLDGSAEASELPREQTANLLTARNAVAQGDSTLVGDRSDITADYMDAAIPIMGGRKRLHHLHPGQQGHSDGPELPALPHHHAGAGDRPADLCPVELPAVQDHGGPHRKAHRRGRAGGRGRL